MGRSPPGSSVYGILQARILEWVAVPSSRGSSWPRNWTCVSCIADRLSQSHQGSFCLCLHPLILCLLSRAGTSLHSNCGNPLRPLETETFLFVELIVIMTRYLIYACPLRAENACFVQYLSCLILLNEYKAHILSKRPLLLPPCSWSASPIWGARLGTQRDTSATPSFLQKIQVFKSHL